MIALIARLLGVNTLAAGLITYGAAALLLGGSLWGYGAYKHHEGYSAGQLAERLVWQEQQRRAQIKAEAKAKAQQVEIDAAALEYAKQQHADEQHIASLEEDIRLQKDEDLGPSDPKTGPACHAGIPARVSIGIDGVGR
ncbi:hypothetical protein [Mesorhizobium sp. B263B2A]|uniref:hypothetical protein n=1 Tax=Mesorhizobium sp. B263B2A TaxID=2876669 RepID=UPI001CD160B4|nr:hypothetical protein [Mesorhizobium sp. B263B2A]MCA0032778.1 hypothetical protein [Mesorhizobium sp. B263B2A]